MTLLSKVELESLLAPSEGSCISIYVPNNKIGIDVGLLSTRLENLLQKAEEILLGIGWRVSDVATLLKPTKALLKSEDIKNQSYGLAVFIAPNKFRYYQLPIYCEELVFVADRFHLKPLMPLFTFEQNFKIKVMKESLDKTTTKSKRKALKSDRTLR
jgi:hypothetical protein